MTDDSRGQAAIDQVEAVRTDLIAALHGFSLPGANHEPLKYAGMSLQDLDRARLFYTFLFTTVRH